MLNFNLRMEVFLPPSLPLILPGFCSYLEYLSIFWWGGEGHQIQFVFVFFPLYHHYGVICAYDMVTEMKIECCIEIYHNLRHCFSRGFEIDGSVGFKT